MGLLSAIGAVAGGFFGGPVGSKIGESFGGAFDERRERREELAASNSFVQRRVADARKAGIHPLVALGANYSSPYGTPISTSTGVPEAISGQADATASRKADSQISRLREAQIDTEKAKAAALIAEARSRTAISSARSSSQGGPIPLWVQYQDRDGNILYGPNPNIPDIEQMPVPAMIHGTDVVVGDMPAPPPRRSDNRGIRPGSGHATGARGGKYQR